MPSLKESYVKNGTQIGDPVSLKSETSTTIPTPDENGASATSTEQTIHSSSGRAAKDVGRPQDSYASSSAPIMAPAPTEQDKSNRGVGGKRNEHGETLREKAAKKLHGDQANPSQLGDPVSLKAEANETLPQDEEAGARHSRRDSKL